MMTKDRFSTGPSGRMPISAIGIPWYREDDYSEVLRIMADGKVLPDTFKDWHQKAQAVERQVKASGKLAHRAIVDPKAFVGWCAIRNLKIDAHARSLFASEAAYKAFQEKG